MIRRIHFTKDAIKPLKSTVRYLGNSMKPRAFWYSIEGNGDGWSDWCRSEMPHWINNHKAYEVEVDLTRILLIDSVDAFDKFQAEFSVPMLRETHLPNGYVRWRAVADHHDGIEINPYLWSQRMGPLWYYGWDCASGCIWRKRAVLRIEEVVDFVPAGVDQETTADAD